MMYTMSRATCCTGSGACAASSGATAAIAAAVGGPGGQTHGLRCIPRWRGSRRARGPRGLVLGPRLAEDQRREEADRFREGDRVARRSGVRAPVHVARILREPRPDHRVPDPDRSGPLRPGNDRDDDLLEDETEEEVRPR